MVCYVQASQYFVMNFLSTVTLNRGANAIFWTKTSEDASGNCKTLICPNLNPLWLIDQSFTCKDNFAQTLLAEQHFPVLQEASEFLQRSFAP